MTGKMNSYSISFGKIRPLSSVCTILFAAIAIVVALADQGRADCSVMIPAQTPLNDLGPGFYNVAGVDYQGGLYPNGSNQRPGPYNTLGINLATEIVPRDKNGNPSPNGKIGLVAIGLCNTLMEFGDGDDDAFIPRAKPTTDLSVNSKLVFCNGAQAGADAPAWTSPTSTAWMTVLNPNTGKLKQAGLEAKQVQVVWLKEAWVFDCPNRHCTQGSPIPFPDHASGLGAELKAILLAIKTNFPQIRIIYISPRTRAYSINFHNPEPEAYETGFAVKWAIADVINQTSPVAYPWTCWGPYLWTDGTKDLGNGIKGRSDGLTWECGNEGSHFANDVRHLTENETPDFVHPAKSFQGRGVMKVADQLIAFFKTDPTAAPWFLKPPAVGRTLTILTTEIMHTPRIIQFNATVSSGCTIDKYHWSFDDGDAVHDNQSPIKMFPAPGTYLVQATAIDDCNNNIRGNTTITVP